MFLVVNGHVKRICDPDIQSNVLEMMGTDVKTTYISSPLNQKKRLGIKYPYLTLVLKNVLEGFINQLIPNLVKEILVRTGRNYG